MRETPPLIERRSQVQRSRDSLNTLPIVAAGILWFIPLTGVWIRFFPPLRPFYFHEPLPSPIYLVAGVLLCCVPFILPRAYFHPKNFERGSLYPLLGVKLFRRFAPDGDWVNLRVRKIDSTYRVIHDRADLQKHIEGTYANERAHLAMLLAGVFSTVMSVSFEDVMLPAALTAGNIVFNLYPILHQRYKRARIRRSANLVR